MSRPRRERRRVVAVEAVGPYALVRVERGGLDPGRPGQFFMLEAPGRVLPRPMSLCLAPRGRARLPARSDRPGHACARRARARRRACTSSAHSATASASTSTRPLLVGGGIGIAPLPYLSEALEQPPAVLGFRSEHHAEAAALVPNAEVVIDPVLVTEVMPARPRRPRMRPGADARSGAGALLRTPSSRGRRRWPAATAHVTAASSRSTAS